jgi:hypothetical protein
LNGDNTRYAKWNWPEKRLWDEKTRSDFGNRYLVENDVKVEERPLPNKQKRDRLGEIDNIQAVQGRSRQKD